jgi:hypothetical protein
MRIATCANEAAGSIVKANNKASAIFFIMIRFLLGIIVVPKQQQFRPTILFNLRPAKKLCSKEDTPAAHIHVQLQAIEGIIAE